MVVWIDAQLAPTLAGWLRDTLGVAALAARDLQLRDAEDPVIFQAARSAGAVVLTKDADFVTLVGRHGPPPQIVWLTCGNTSNRALRELLSSAWPRVVALLEAGEPLVEISGRASQLTLQQTTAFRKAACGRILLDALAAELDVVPPLSRSRCNVPTRDR